MVTKRGSRRPEIAATVLNISVLSFRGARGGLRDLEVSADLRVGCGHPAEPPPARATHRAAARAGLGASRALPSARGLGSRPGLAPRRCSRGATAAARSLEGRPRPAAGTGSEPRVCRSAAWSSSRGGPVGRGRGRAGASPPSVFWTCCSAGSCSFRSCGAQPDLGTAAYRHPAPHRCAGPQRFGLLWPY